MPRPKKRPVDLTTEEAMKKLFPKPVREKAKETAQSSQKSRSQEKDTP